MPRFFKNTSRFVFALLILFSCVPADVKQTADTPFFDLKGFLNWHIQNLEKTELQIRKTTKLQEKEHTQILKKINWKEELAFFFASDINTPQLRDSYQIQKTPKKWNFKTDNEGLIVREIQVIFKNENDTSFVNVKQVLILQRDKNHLYNNQKKLELNIRKGFLKSYSITGTEEMILGEKQVFEVKSEVLAQ